MLVLVLLLVVAASSALVASVVAAHPEWAWAAVLLCVLGAALLVVEGVRRRRGESASTVEPLTTDASGGAHTDEAAVVPDRTQLIEESAAEPDIEDTGADDLRLVANLTMRVLVIDEHPRYHLDNCSWLVATPTIPIALREARELGFTPCARCTPDAVLAARLRASRGPQVL